MSPNRRLPVKEANANLLPVRRRETIERRGTMREEQLERERAERSAEHDANRRELADLPAKFDQVLSFLQQPQQQLQPLAPPPPSPSRHKYRNFEELDDEVRS
ncbi:MAG: hypothetical protein BJ554DRAFT_4428, partial [Olpidium bornovanus]